MEILKRLKTGKLIAFDQDEDARQNVPDDNRIIFLNQNFRFLRNNLRYNGIETIDGLLADLGVSFHQFDEPERGFTFRHDAPLDMRMSRNNKVTAAYILNNMDESSLADLFFNYGELTGSRRIAKEIVRSRSVNPLTTAGDMLAALESLTPVRQTHKFYARIFQALRIAVNREIDYLKEMLEQALDVLNKGGRLVVISYHSLEDRIVKNFMRTGNFEGEERKDFYGNLITPFRLMNRKGTTPGEKEIARNKRARSARLRIAEKI